MKNTIFDNISELLKDAGNILLKMKENSDLSYQIKGSQVKAKADIVIHKHLEENLKLINPNAFFVSEENKVNISANKILDLDECFLVDPIDGTASYVGGYKGYVIQLAYLKKGVPLYSLVYAPEFNKLYYGIKNEGSYLNEKRIKVKKSLEEVIYIDNYPSPQTPLKNMMKLHKNSKYLECGSIGLKICKIAEGEADIFYKDVLVRDWDLVPPSLILKEAGGLLLSLKEKPFIFFKNNDYSHEGFLAISNLVFKETLKEYNLRFS